MSNVTPVTPVTRPDASPANVCHRRRRLALLQAPAARLPQD
jgi:hypothetical protein